MHEDVVKEISSLQENSQNQIQKINEDAAKATQKVNEGVLKEIQLVFEKSIKTQMELEQHHLLPPKQTITAQRWLYAKLNGNMDKLNQSAQYPSPEQLNSLGEKDELETFQICGVLYKANFSFDFLYSNGLKPIQGVKDQ